MQLVAPVLLKAANIPSVLFLSSFYNVNILLGLLHKLQSIYFSEIILQLIPIILVFFEERFRLLAGDERRRSELGLP